MSDTSIPPKRPNRPKATSEAERRERQRASNREYHRLRKEEINARRRERYDAEERKEREKHEIDPELGILRRVIELESDEQGCTLKDLTALSIDIDPYRLETEAGRTNGAWVAEQLDLAIGIHRRIHLRGLHYALVVGGNILKPDGTVYRNTDADWTWLTNKAVKAARWLGLVSFERITDNRNSAPVIHRKPEVTPRRQLSLEIDVEIPDADDIKPDAWLSDFEGRQPYAIVIFGEKASLEDVLLPIARQYEADLYLMSGEISDTLLWQMAKDAVADGRPMAVFVCADFDPSGNQMAVSIGRKFQALRHLCFPGLKFEVVPVALTIEQVRELSLPSTPLKETDKRAVKWRKAFGHEQTEIDALATLRPRELERIVHAAIGPYFDHTLARRVSEAEDRWEEAAQEAIAYYLGDTLDAIRLRAAGTLAALKAEMESINSALGIAAEDIELPDAIVPAALIDEKALRLCPANFVGLDMGQRDARAEGA
jgi:hypothetical protein